MEVVFVYTDSRFGPPHASLESVILELTAQSNVGNRRHLRGISTTTHVAASLGPYGGSLDETVTTD